jgi:hypothetical protein
LTHAPIGWHSLITPSTHIGGISGSDDEVIYLAKKHAYALGHRVNRSDCAIPNPITQCFKSLNASPHIFRNTLKQKDNTEN